MPDILKGILAGILCPALAFIFWLCSKGVLRTAQTPAAPQLNDLNLFASPRATV